MKRNPLIIFTLATALLTINVGSTQPKPTNSATPASVQSPSITEPQVKKLIQEEIEKGGVIRDRVQADVNQTFGWTIGLLQILTGVLAALPIFSAILLWCLRAGIKKQLIDEIRKEVKDEVAQQIQTTTKEELEVKIETLHQEVSATEQKIQKLYDDYEKEVKRRLAELPNSISSGTSTEASPKLQQALGEIEILRSLLPDLPLSAEDYFKLGNGLYNEGRYEEAIASYEKALQIKPDLHKAWNNQGVALNKLGRYEEAITSFDQALRFKLDYPAWSNKGIALRKLGRYENAIASHDQALKIKPDFAGAWFNKACVYALQRNIDQTLENLAQAIQLEPTYRENAKNESDFNLVRNDERFKKLLEE